MAVNQQQIADELNLSIITVSRALRNQPYLSEETRNRVLQKARELGYTKAQARPVTAGAAAPRRAGVIFYESSSQAKVHFGSRVRNSIFYSLQKQCQSMNVETLVETAIADEVPMLVRNRTIDVAFVFGRYTPESISHLRGIPTLAVSSFISCPDLPRIVADNNRGMQEATEHLIGLGHRAILFLGVDNPHTRIFRERAHGYLLAMHDRGLTPTIQLYPGWLTPAFHVPVEKLAGFTAIVCASDALAYHVQGLLEQAGRRLPQDCSIVGFDNLPEDHPLSRRKITSYGPDWSLMGRMAADLMFSRPLDIQNQGIVVTVPGTLQIYDSTAAPASAV